MEPECSLPHLHVPATCPYPGPDKSSSCPASLFLKILPSTPRSFKWFFPSGFPTKTLWTPLPSPIRATCPAHLILLDSFLLMTKINNNNNSSYVRLEMYAVWMQDLLVMRRIACILLPLHSRSCEGRFKRSCRPLGGRHAAKHAMSAAWEFFISACERKELKNCTKITTESRKFPY